MCRSLLFLALAGCASGEPVLDDYDATVMAMRTLVTDHADAAAATGSVDDLLALEPDYRDGWSDLASEMHGHMDEIGGCTMSGMGGSMMAMDDADGTMGMMDDAMDSHMEHHAEHADVADCQADEADHADTMGGMLDDMMGYAEGWSANGMHCGG